MDKIKAVFAKAVAWYQSLSPNWQRALQVAAALIVGFVSGKIL